MAADVLEEKKDIETQPGPGPVSGRRAFLSRIIIPVILGILIVGVIALSLRVKNQASRLREETQKRESGELRIAGLEENISRHLSRINDLQNSLNETGVERDGLRADVTGLKTEQARVEAQLKSSEETRKNLEERIRAEEAVVVELQKKLDDERQTQKMLFSKIERLTEEKATLKEKVANLEKGIPGTGTITMPELQVSRQHPSPALIRGTILAVNRRYDFVVFSLGENDGVKAGDRFAVFDHDQKVGEIVARRVLAAMTVADIIPEQTQRRLKQNFTVTFL